MSGGMYVVCQSRGGCCGVCVLQCVAVCCSVLQCVAVCLGGASLVVGDMYSNVSVPPNVEILTSNFP